MSDATSPATGSEGPPSDSSFFTDSLPVVETAQLADTDDGQSEAPGVDEPQPEQQTQAEQETAPAATDATRLQQLIAEHAAKLKIDPNDPNFSGILKQLADKDLYIEQLKAGKPPEAPAQPTADYLTEYEKELFKEQDPSAEQPQQTATPPVQPGQTAAPAPIPLGDIGDTWKGPDDAYAALNQAWAAEGGPDLKRVNDIEVAMFTRRALEVVPQILQRMPQQIAQRIVQQALGQNFMETLPEIQETFRSHRTQQDAEFAVAELKKNQNYSDLDKLYEKEGDGEIEVFGQTVPNTPLNRIIKANPWITEIQPRGDVKDPRAAARLGHMNRLRAVHQIFRAEQQAKNAIDPKQAQVLVDAGRKVQERTNGERTRQALNAGSGATTAAGQQPAHTDYVSSLTKSNRSVWSELG